MSLVRLALVAITFASNVSHAEMYKCVEGGKTVFQERPCKGGGGAVNIRPQSGDGPAAASAQSKPAGQPDAAQAASNQSAASKAESQLQTMQRDRRLREIGFEIADAERAIRNHNEGLDAELAALRNKKRYANNNLAGATWEQSISAEMQAVSHKYKTKISIEQGKIDRLRREEESLRASK